MDEFQFRVIFRFTSFRFLGNSVYAKDHRENYFRTTLNASETEFASLFEQDPKGLFGVANRERLNTNKLATVTSISHSSQNLSLSLS